MGMDDSGKKRKIGSLERKISPPLTANGLGGDNVVKSKQEGSIKREQRALQH